MDGSGTINTFDEATQITHNLLYTFTTRDNALYKPNLTQKSSEEVDRVLEKLALEVAPPSPLPEPYLSRHMNGRRISRRIRCSSGLTSHGSLALSHANVIHTMPI